MTAPSDRLPNIGVVAAHWWEYQRRSHGLRDEREALETGQPEEVLAARAIVDQVVERGGPAALELMEALIDCAPAGDGVVAVGVGPLEDLVHQHGDDLAGDIERYARQNPSFAAALALARIERGHLTSATEHRLNPWIGGLTTSP